VSRLFCRGQYGFLTPGSTDLYCIVTPLTHFPQLVEYDDASSPQTVDLLYQGLTRILNVTAVFGPWSSSLNLPAMNRAKATNTPMVFGGGASPVFFSGTYTNSVGTLMQVGNRLLSCSQMLKDLGARTAAIIYSNDTYGTSCSSAWRAQMASMNITVVGARSFLFGSPETARADIKDLITSFRPELFLVGNSGGDDLESLIVSIRSIGDTLGYKANAIVTSNSCALLKCTSSSF
jgi:ABC-type branched-subunit amino acid transport system substrate-binding protein